MDNIIEFPKRLSVPFLDAELTNWYRSLDPSFQLAVDKIHASLRQRYELVYQGIQLQVSEKADPSDTAAFSTAYDELRSVALKSLGELFIRRVQLLAERTGMPLPV